MGSYTMLAQTEKRGQQSILGITRVLVPCHSISVSRSPATLWVSSCLEHKGTVNKCWVRLDNGTVKLEWGRVHLPLGKGKVVLAW